MNTTIWLLILISILGSSYKRYKNFRKLKNEKLIDSNDEFGYLRLYFRETNNIEHRNYFKKYNTYTIMNWIIIVFGMVMIIFLEYSK